jgi:hypothetical protein
MKPRLFVIACSGITLAWCSLATSRGLDPPQQEDERVGYTRTFTPISNHDSYSYPFHDHAATGCVVFWGGESSAEIFEFRIASPASETNWSKVAEIAPASNLVRPGTPDEGIGTLDGASHSFRFVVYTPATRTTISANVDASLTRAESGTTWFEPSINWSTGGNELAFNWTIHDDFASAEVDETNLFGSSCQNSTNRHAYISTSHLSMTETLKPPSDGGGWLLAIVTGVPVTPVNPAGG